jgi:hypothetical protein
MYAQILLVTSVRGIGVEPTIAASGPVGINGLMNAAFGLRATFFFAAFFGAAFFAAFFAVFSSRLSWPAPSWPTSSQLSSPSSLPSTSP